MTPKRYAELKRLVDGFCGDIPGLGGLVMRELLAEIERLQAGLAAIESRWREASKDTCFRRNYRETMELCADELRDLLGGVDDKELQAEIDKAFTEGDL